MYLKLNASYYMQQKSEIRILDAMALGQGGGWGGERSWHMEMPISGILCLILFLEDP